MEENSDNHMETDVSSTTDDGPETQQVTGSHGDIEMVIVVEKLKDEEDNAIDSKCEQSEAKNVSSASASGETTPKKDVLPQNIVIKPSIKENNSPKFLLKPPVKCDSPKTMSNEPLVMATVKSSPAKQQSETADSSTRVDTISPTQISTDCSPFRITQVQKVYNRLKDMKLTKSPINISRLPDKSPNKEVQLQEKSPSKVVQVQESPVKINSKEKLNNEDDKEKYNKVAEMQEMPVINSEQLQELSPDKEPNLEEDSKTEVEIKDKSSVKDKPIKIALIKDTSMIKTDETSKKPADLNTSINNNETSKSYNGSDKPNTATPANITIDNDELNDSQASIIDIPEKEHNKSISRELKSLINSAKESKIISECTQLTSKTRKSRANLDTPNTSLEGDKIGGNRRGSTNSQISNCSEKSDKATLKRSMRSQNPEFVNKCKQFLSSVTSKVMKEDDVTSEDETCTKQINNAEAGTEHNDSLPVIAKKKKISDQPVILANEKGKLRSDSYCWRCHWTVEQEENDKSHPPLRCTVCPRSFHYKCLTANERKTPPEKNWVCPDCLQILSAESSETRSPAMKKITLGMLCELLKHALERMTDINGVEPFLQPVDRTTFPDYDKYVVHPMDLSQMKQNIVDGHYGSTEAFVADVQWILHNSIIFNTLQSKLTGGARALVRSCRAEMGEIEACPECYAAAHARRATWFTDVCAAPHILLWAKLKGFPYWPAKGMTVNSAGMVDVRFFGAHDRAWVPAKDCFLFSEKDPNNFRSKRQDILDSMQEAEQHIRNISRKYGKFVYPPFKTQFDPTKLSEQLKIMIPTFEGEVKMLMKEKSGNASPLSTKEKRRSYSKSSKSSANDGDGSDTEDTPTTSQIIISKTEKEDIADKTKPMEVEMSTKEELETIPSRKRRRSNLEEAVLTILENYAGEKKKRLEDDAQKKTNSQPTTSKEEKLQLIKGLDITVTTSKKKTDMPKGKSKDNEQSCSTLEEKESLRVTPIKLVALPRPNKQTPKMFTTSKVSSKPSTPKEEDKTPQKTKLTRSDKTATPEMLREAKTQRRSNSKSNKSLNISSSTPKSAKIDKKPEIGNEASNSKELRSKDNKKKDSDSEGNNSMMDIGSDTPKQGKIRTRFADDTSLAVLARERRNSHAGLPTISNVCSLSTTAQASTPTTTNTTSSAKSIEITIETNSDSSIFTPTSTENVRNMNDAVTKLQKLRDNAEPVVGRVGVRAFARMTSPDRAAESVEVEIKAEPVDLAEADEERHNEKMDLMNACKLRPVNPPQSLRDVRINRVVAGTSYIVKKTGKPEARPRAKKTFPQPRRVEDSGRSELNGKNSMVYIPIQPPMTQAPVRPPRPVAPPTSGNNTVNTVTTPLKPSTSTLSSPVTSVSSTTTVIGPTAGQTVPTVGSTTVHTVPLMTSVNGQWVFSLQPVMSVGGVDTATPPAMVNGVAERGNAPPPIVAVNPPNTPATVPAAPAQGNRTAETTPAELPRLQQRPALQSPLDANFPIGAVPTPSTAGPLTAKLNQNAVKLADFFRTLLEDSIEKLDEPASSAAALRLQLEQLRWRHSQEIDEIKHNYELSLAEMRMSFEKEKLRVVSEARRAAQLDLEAAVKLAKSKQWCANCSQEAQFYCCWNTAYCDLSCQRVHWPHHFASCAQRPKDGNEDEANTSESRQQPQSDSMPKSGPPPAPALTVGGKVAARNATDAPAAPSAPAPKTSIIVSMVEDNSGNQTMKCVGTYKPGAAQAQMSPLIINKQVTNDESGKKVVTSGGYLIVGAGGSVLGAPARRNHIQYFT